MSMLAAIRPDEWNWALLLHVGGAMILVGGMLTAVSALTLARGHAGVLRLGYWSLLAVSLPGYILMRIGAAWINSKEGWDELPDDAQPAWLGIGFLTGDLGGPLLLIVLIIGGVGTYRLRGGKGNVLFMTTMVLSLILLAAFTVTIWAMSAKPD